MTDLTLVYNEDYLFTVERYHAPVPMCDDDYFILFKRGIRRMFVDTGRGRDYVSSYYTYDTLDECPYDFDEDEIEYIVTAAKIEFYAQMITDVSDPNRITRHSTDALTVQFADKGVAELNGMIAPLEDRLNEIYFKMVRFHRKNNGRWDV